MIEIIAITIIAAGSSALSTLTGFGTSSIMVPILSLFYPLHQTLLFVGILHFIGAIWKAIIFKKGFRWNIVLLFGIPATIASFLGAYTTFKIPEQYSYKLLGLVLLIYSITSLIKPNFEIPKTKSLFAGGGFLSGFFAGIIGLGGAIRATFLHAFNLPKIVYLFSANFIALFIDASRISTYLYFGAHLSRNLLISLLLSLFAALTAIFYARKFILLLPQEKYRKIVSIFFGLFGIYFLFR